MMPIKSVIMPYKRMGIPVPIVGRGLNPHEAIRESVFTLDGPVMADRAELASNHKFVMLDPAGGCPAFSPLEGHESMDDLITFLSNLDPKHTWTTTHESSPAEPAEKKPLDPTTDAELITAQETYISTNTGVQIMDGTTKRDATAADAQYKLILPDPFVSVEASIIQFEMTDPVPATDNAAEVLEERLTWLANRIFLIRCGTEFVEMQYIDPVLGEETMDAAHDMCVRLRKCRISNLCVLELADDTKIQEAVDNTVPGECCCFFFNEATEGGETMVKVAFAPASFGHIPEDTGSDDDNPYDGPFSSWTKVACPAVTVNKAYPKRTTDARGVSHVNVMLDITC